jgi:hypothetical protein
MKYEFENQCLNFDTEDVQDEIYIRDANGKLVRVEVEDDEDN